VRPGFLGFIYKGYEAKEAGKPQEAFELFCKALESEPQSPIAAYEVGCYYEEGQLVPKDLAKAFELYSQAADGCVEAAQKKLGDWYAQGIFVQADAAQSEEWRRKAANHRNNLDDPAVSLAESIVQKVQEMSEKDLGGNLDLGTDLGGN